MGCVRQVQPFAMAASSLLVVVLFQRVAAEQLLRWWLPMLCLQILYQQATRHCLRRAETDPAAIDAGWRGFCLGAVGISIGWGCTVWMVWPADDLHYSLVLVAWLVAVCSTHSALLSGQRALFYYCLCAVWGMLLWRLFTLPQEVLFWVGLSALVYALVLIRFTRQLHASVLESFSLRVENQCLLDEQAEQRQRLQRYNRQLERDNAILNDTLRRIEDMVQRDPMTHVLNLRALMQAAEQAVVQAEAGDQPFAAALFDLDHFKNVNDRFGHQVGDEVLCRFCELVSAELREGDAFGRYGGEEFLLLAAESEGGSLLPRLDALRIAVERENWSRLAPGLRVTVSIGVAGWARGDTVRCWLERADVALYQAKRGGRNRVAAAGPAGDPP
ncbi:hypothetical protein CEK28_07295 [Xenophilus sp. AP218F]|nr:hypothetical protein CEK28_07295 [Xenophilus sp. AP218F]